MPVRIALVVIVLVGVIAGRAAQSFLPALNTPSSRLAQLPPFVEPAPLPPLARRVVLVVVDGFRWDASRNRMALDALRARGVDVKARAPFPTISKSNYVTLMSGVSQRHSGARTNDGFRPHTIDSLFDRMTAAGRSSGYLADKTRGIARLFDVKDAVRAPLGAELDAAFAQSHARNDLLALLLMEVDGAGHDHGGTSDEYDAAVRVTVDQIGRVAAAMDLSRDALVITADHGHTDRGGHGGLGPEVEDVPLILVGAGIRAGARASSEVSLVDVAPTVAALLGVPAPGHSHGRTLVELLALTPEQQQRVVAADARRIAHVGEIVARLDADDTAAYERERLVRMPIAIGLIGGLFAIVIVGRRRAWWTIGRRIALAGAIYIVLFAALEFGFDRVFQLPTVPASRLAVWYHTALYGGIAVVVHVTVGIVVIRRAADRVRAALGVLVIGAVATWIPALLAWALAGPAHAELLPTTEILIAAPYAWVAVAHHALAAVLISVATLGSRRRALPSDPR